VRSGGGRDGGPGGGGCDMPSCGADPMSMTGVTTVTCSVFFQVTSAKELARVVRMCVLILLLETS
jgi:hypothetical protein